MKAGLPIVTVVIIAIVAMVIATIVLFLALPWLEDLFGEPDKPPACADTCYEDNFGPITDTYVDCNHPNRYIIYWHETTEWQYRDGFEGFMSIKFDTLHALRQATQAEYEGGTISEGSWHWFNCTAGAIS